MWLGWSVRSWWLKRGNVIVHQSTLVINYLDIINLLINWFTGNQHKRNRSEIDSPIDGQQLNEFDLSLSQSSLEFDFLDLGPQFDLLELGSDIRDILLDSRSRRDTPIPQLESPAIFSNPETTANILRSATEFSLHHHKCHPLYSGQWILESTSRTQLWWSLG